MKQIFTFSLVFLLFFTISGFAGNALVGYMPNEIAIKLSKEALADVDYNQLKEGYTGLRELDQVNAYHKVSRLKEHFPNFRNRGNSGKVVTLDQWFLIYFPDGADVEALAAEYKALADVIEAAPIPICKINITPDDPEYPYQWHLDKDNEHDPDIDAPEAWEIETGSTEIIVAMLDSGVRYYHKDLGGGNASAGDRNSIKGNIWINTDELANDDPNDDDDENGYKDDWVGWDFVDGNPQSYTWSGEDYDDEDNDPRDYNGHGTHCAGNVSAINNNDRGLCAAGGGWGEDANGLGNGVKIMCLRIGWNDKDAWGNETGYVSMSFAANAFTYAADNGAHIASCSWGSSWYPALEDAINYFLYGTTNPGGSEPQLTLIFSAAGNSSSTSADYMCSRSDVIAVAATTSSDNAADFTNYGSWVDISAPGKSIYSTYHDHYSAGKDDYATLSGTSMSAPIAASVAALIWSHDLTLSAEDVQTYLYDGADDIEDELDSKYKGKMGVGRVTAYGSLSLFPSALAAVSDALPEQFELRQNYPNPFNPATTIKFGIPEAAKVTVDVYNVVGVKVATVFEGVKSAGYHQVDFNADNLASGIYFYRIASENFTAVKKMMLIK